MTLKVFVRVFYNTLDIISKGELCSFLTDDKRSYNSRGQ